MRRAMVLFASIPCISLFAALQAQAVVHAEQDALSTPSTDTFCWADFDADGLDVAGGDKARVFVDKDEGARRRDRIMVNCGDWSLAPSLSFASSLRSSF